MERDPWMDQNKKVIAQLVSTIDTDNVKSPKQDKRDIPEYRKPLIFFGIRTVSRLRRTSRMREWSRVSCAQQECMNLIPDALCF